MTLDWKDQNEQPNDKVEKSDSRPDQATQRAMQDGSDPAGDRTFSDREGREVTLRTYPSGSDRYYIRAYDNSKIERPPETVNPGQAGYANLQIEQNEMGTRARLQDIKTPPAYEGNGIGGEMLNQAERIARHRDAREIYGLAPADQQTLDWYFHRNYRIRANNSDGTEVYKLLR